MLIPEAVFIDGRTGAVPYATEVYVKPVRELHGLYQDAAAFNARVAAQPDAIGYEVASYRKDGSDLFFGTTTMAPGKIGDEYFMTRGHYHVRRDCGEVYCTQSGVGVLLLQTRKGETCELKMTPGICAFIPPGWAHRSVNVGAEPLVFTWVCQTAAGHDYGNILTYGMRRLAVERHGVMEIVANPQFDNRLRHGQGLG